MPKKRVVPRTLFYVFRDGERYKEYFEPFPAFDVNEAIKDVDEVADFMKRMLVTMPISGDTSYEFITSVFEGRKPSKKHTPKRLLREDMDEVIARVKDMHEIASNDTGTYDDDLQEYCINAMREIGALYLSSLMLRSRSSRPGLKALKCYAEETCAALHFLTEMRSDLAVDIARKSVNWSANFGPRPRDLKKIRRKVEELELAEEKMSGKGKKPPVFSKPGTRVAKSLIVYIREFKRTTIPDTHGSKAFSEVYPFPEEIGAAMLNLSNPNVTNADDWANACWDLLMFFTDGHPEHHPQLKVIGDSTAKSYLRAYQGDERIPATKKAADNKRRIAIRKRIIECVPVLIAHGVGSY